MSLSTTRALARPYGFPLQELPPDLVAVVIRKSSVCAIVKLSETNRFFRRRCLDVGKLLLEELWKLAAPLSWSARSHGVNAIHTLALFNGWRLKVPTAFFMFVIETFQDLNTEIDIDIRAMERMYLIFGDIGWAISPAFFASCGRTRGRNAEFFTSHNFQTRNRHPPYRIGDFIIRDEIRPLLTDIKVICENVFFYTNSRFHSHIKTSDISEALALTRRRMRPLGSWLRCRTCDVDGVMPWKDFPDPDPDDDGWSQAYNDPFEEEHSSEFGVEVTPPIMFNRRYFELSDHFDAPWNFSQKTRTSNGELPPAMQQFLDSNAGFFHPEHGFPEGAPPCTDATCCHLACFCCSSIAVCGIAIDSFVAKMKAADDEFNPETDDPEEYLQRLDHELSEATLHAMRRHHQGPCALTRANRSVRERFVNWREMGASPGAREWLESMGMQVTPW